MKLLKNPETEMEYWGVIEGLGGFAWRMNHDLADGRIEDKTGGVDKDIQEAQELSAKLVSELKEKFGVIPPEECPKLKLGEKAPPAPEGKIYYWDWYQKMKELYWRVDYEKLICGACPFSKGVEEMIRMGGNIPCGRINGSIYQLRPSFQCHFTHFRELTPEQLYGEILKKGGEPALISFKVREAGLKALVAAGEIEI